MSTFRFEPRWKEELVCTGPGGSFILYLPMGVLTALLPTEEEWQRRAPEWARDMWPQLHRDLQAWCRQNRAQLVIEPSAVVY